MAAEPPFPSRPPSLRAALGVAIGGYLESTFAFIVTNGAWLLAVVALGALTIGVPLAMVLLPLLALPTSSLTRLGVAAARADVPTLRLARVELGRLAGRKIGLAALQLVVLAVSLTSLQLALEMGGVPGVVSAAAAAYAMVGVALLSLAMWPIVCDPQRAAPTGQQLRLALAVVLRRPLQLLVLGILAALAIALSVQLIVPALFLPSLVLLAVAGYVVPAADELVPLEA